MSNSLRTVVLLMLLAFSQVALGGKARQTVSNRWIQEYDDDSVKQYFPSDININHQTVLFPDEFVVQENAETRSFDIFRNDFIDPSIALDFAGASFTQPENGEASFDDSYPPLITYKPNLGFTGWERFEYTVCEEVAKRDDQDTCFIGHIVIFVVASRDVPVAVSDFGSLDDESPNSVIVDVLDNDYDADGPFANWDSLQVVWPYAEHGIATVTDEYQIKYVRTDDRFVGVDTIYYKICDIIDTQLCAYASVSITVNACSTCESCGELSDIFRDHLQSIHNVFRSDVLNVSA